MGNIFLENNIFIAIYASIFVSFMLSKYVFKFPTPMSRSNYFLCWSFLNVFFCINTIYSIYVIEIDTNNIVPLICIYLLINLAIGLLLGFIARKRAVDAWGNDDRFYLGVIPFANLILNFKKPAIKRNRKLNFLFASIKILIGVALISISNGIVNEVLKMQKKKKSIV